MYNFRPNEGLKPNIRWLKVSNFLCYITCNTALCSKSLIFAILDIALKANHFTEKTISSTQLESAISPNSSAWNEGKGVCSHNWHKQCLSCYDDSCPSCWLQLSLHRRHNLDFSPQEQLNGTPCWVSLHPKHQEVWLVSDPSTSEAFAIQQMMHDSSPVAKETSWILLYSLENDKGAQQTDFKSIIKEFFPCLVGFSDNAETL